MRSWSNLFLISTSWNSNFLNCVIAQYPKHNPNIKDGIGNTCIKLYGKFNSQNLKVHWNSSLIIRYFEKPEIKKIYFCFLEITKTVCCLQQAPLGGSALRSLQIPEFYKSPQEVAYIRIRFCSTALAICTFCIENPFNVRSQKWQQGVVAADHSVRGNAHSNPLTFSLRRGKRNLVGAIQLEIAPVCGVRRA